MTSTAYRQDAQTLSAYACQVLSDPESPDYVWTLLYEENCNRSSAFWELGSNAPREIYVQKYLTIQVRLATFLFLLEAKELADLSFHSHSTIMELIRKLNEKAANNRRILRWLRIAVRAGRRRS